MKKTLLSLAFLSITYCAYAQVGVGTDAPQSTLHVVGKPTDTATPDGIIAPNIKRTELIAKNSKYVGGQTGAIVYVYDIAGTADAVGGKAEDVTTVGYYYFDGIKWVKLSTPNSQDLRFVGTNNHVTQDAGVGSNGTSLGTGTNNIAIGKDGLKNITTGSNNIAIGANSLAASSIKGNIIAIGNNALAVNTALDGTIAIGENALAKSTASNNSDQSLAIGNNALSQSVDGDGNTAVGYNALSKATSSYNTALGTNSLTALTTGGLNTAIGNKAFLAITTGSYNTGLGYRVANTMNMGSQNTFLGANTAVFLKTGATHSNNTFVGSEVTTPSDIGQGVSVQYTGTTALGQHALNALPTTLTQVTNGLFLGKDATVAPASTVSVLDHATAIGADAVVGASNSIVLGRADANGNQDKVGIGVVAPTNALHVKSTSNPVKLEGLQADNTAANVVVVGADGVLKTVLKSSIVGVTGDTTNDAWINNTTNTRVELGTLSDGITTRTAGTEIVATDAGRLGIGTATPNSTLTVDGSFEGAYKEITSNITLTDKDYYITYNGATAGVVTLPIVGTGVTSFTGRIYRIKNISNVNVTVMPATGNTLRAEKTAVNSFTLAPGTYLEIVNNANTTGTTWDISFIGKPTNTNVEIYGTQLKIPRHSGSSVSSPEQDFSNHSNSAYDSGVAGDNWWVISKTSTNASNSSAYVKSSRMLIVYEYQGTPFNLANLYPIITTGNDQNHPDIFAASFVTLKNDGTGGKTRLTVSVARVDYMGNDGNGPSNWDGTFLLNVLLARKVN